ncbi:MAG: hypothetical protein WCJ85_01430 [Chitinophagaceae bacterium]
MLKLNTVCTGLIIFLVFINACNRSATDTAKEIDMAQLDAQTEAIIDSAYLATTRCCDSLLIHQVPIWSKEIMLKDSSHLLSFIDSMQQYSNQLPKLEKVIRQLKLDCATSLRTETYRRAFQLQKSKLPIKGH